MAGQARELDYFRFIPWYYWLWEAPLLVILVMGVFCPTAIPYSLMGPPGDFLYYMNFSQRTITCGLFALTVMVHIGETLQAFSLTRKMNLNTKSQLLWMAQTFVFGFSSLGILKAKYQKKT